MYDVTEIFRAIAAITELIKNERDPVTNTKREVLSLKKRLNVLREDLSNFGEDFKKAIAGANEKQIQIMLENRMIALKKIEDLKKQLDEF